MPLSADLSRRMNEYGVSTGKFQRTLDAMQAQGLTREQALGRLQNEAQLMDHLRDEFCGGSAEQARGTIAGAEGVRTAIGDAHWHRQLQEWHARNPEAMPEPELLREFSRVADEYVRDLEHGMGGQPGGGAPGGGAGGGGGTPRGPGPGAPEAGAAGRGGTLRGLGPEAPEPASALREHWSSAARESGRAPEPGPGAADRQASAPRAADGRVEAQPVDRAAAAAPDGTATMPALSDRQIQLLGAEAADQAGRLGMRPQDLDNHVGLLYQRELLYGRDPSVARENAAQVARDQIAQVHSLGQELGRELTQYGYSPDDIAQRLVETRAQGLTREQTLASLGREVGYANHLRDEFCGGSMELARAKLAGAGGARQAIKVENWGKQVEAWKASHPDESAGRERLAAFGDRAEEYVRNLDRSLGRPGAR